MTRASRWVCFLAAIGLLLAGQPGAAQGFTQLAFNTSTADVTVVTTAETSIIASGPALAPRQSVNVCVFAWAQFTTSANTTALTARIRRGTTTGGTLVGEANAEQVKAAAASTEPIFITVCEDRADVASVDYNLTITQTAASANGSALQATILVLVR